MKIYKKIKTRLHNSTSVDTERASAYFKTGKGHYAEHDVFIGVTVPMLREIAKEYSTVALEEIQNLIQSKINEERLLALIILTQQYKKANTQDKERIYQFYLQHLKHVNNWNLVDASAHLIMGAHLVEKNRSVLIPFAKSEDLWFRRIAMVSTWAFIKNNDLEWTFKIAKILLEDKHDLIHKAVGWMLREAGKKNTTRLIQFLDQHKERMPRTMLRYSIEKFPEAQRQKYLLKVI